MAAVTVNEIDDSAAVAFTPVDADEASGDTFVNSNGDLALYFINESGTDAATVTLTAQETSKDVSGYGQMSKSNLTISLAAGEDKIVGPLEKRAWNDSSGNVNAAYSGTAAASVKVYAFRLKK